MDICSINLGLHLLDFCVGTKVGPFASALGGNGVAFCCFCCFAVCELLDGSKSLGFHFFGFAFVDVLL